MNEYDTEEGFLDWDESSRSGLSFFWDVALPLGITSTPMICFSVIGWFGRQLNVPMAQVPGWLLYTMMTLQVVGIVTMAVVALVRLERGKRELIYRFPDGAPSWRILCLLLSLCSLTMFEITSNVAVAFAGAEFLWTGAIFFFLFYLMLMSLTFINSSVEEW